MPPLLRSKKFKVSVIGIGLFVSGVLVGNLADSPPEALVIPTIPLFRNIWNQDNSFKAFGCPFIPEYPSTVQGNRIIFCESTDNPDAKNPDSTAHGLGQFTDGTWKFVQEKWNMTLERENAEHQRYAFNRLLAEEGTKHWISSVKCWGY